MSDERIAGRATELAREFDREFSEPRRPVRLKGQDFLVLRAAGEPYVVPVRDIAGLFVDRKIVPAPSAAAELMGIAGLRGGVVPVYSLAALLGLPTGAGAPRWMLLVDAGAPVALAFDQFEGYARLADLELSAADGRGEREMVRVGDSWRNVIGIPALIESIRRRRTDPGTSSDKER